MSATISSHSWWDFNLKSALSPRELCPECKHQLRYLEIMFTGEGDEGYGTYLQTAWECNYCGYGKEKKFLVYKKDNQ